MPQKKDNGALAGGKGDGRGQNGKKHGPKCLILATANVVGSAGNRTGFRTDTAISNSRFGNERVLQPWVPDANDIADGGLESSGNSGHWDQFAANERLFGLKTDYDENIYTTAIDRSHPQFRERIAAAEKKAKEIERTAPTTSHVAEERVMDYTGTGGEDDNEEDKSVPY
jgi:PAB1-binding protein PBP1